METLKHMSMMAVLKLGIPRTELPKTVADEVDTLEARIKLEARIARIARIKSYDPSKKASTALVLRHLQGVTPSQKKEFRAKEKVRIETLQAGLEESLFRSRETQPEKTTVVRPAMVMVKRDSAMEPLMRPTIGGQSDGTDSSRPGSATSAIQAWGVGVDRSTDTNTTRDTLEIDTTKDTLDGVDTTADTIDFRLSQLGLGEVRGLHQLLSLRRPSGLGKM
eukprot:GFUD01029203.1.p1 GENE.GFUD01029203.1~~GFUD01029203.1.p1  ORF type:complete len:221 (-),score=44.97 GFUD01029203.1:344-1006(-)